MTYHWPDEACNHLKIRWPQGASARCIANEINARWPGTSAVSRNAVIGKRIRMGLPDRDDGRRSAGSMTQALRLARARAKAKKEASPRPPQSLKPPKPEPIPEPCAPIKGPNAIRFLDRSTTQCAMFCEGEEGAAGLVCGEPVTRGSYCTECARILWPQARIAAQAQAAFQTKR